MPDRDMVIKGLECCLKKAGHTDCNACPYGSTHNGSTCIDNVQEDALALLKEEQEPKQVKTDMYGNAYCPWCATDRTIEMGAQRLHLGTQFCPYCGKAVKFDDV